MESKFAIVCFNDSFIKSIEDEISSNDKIFKISENLYPIRALDLLHYKIKKTFTHMIIINNMSENYTNGFINDFKKKNVNEGLVVKKTDDIISEDIYSIIKPSAVANDDSIFIPMKIFHGFRNIRPRATLVDIIKILSKQFILFSDASRIDINYESMLREHRLKLEEKMYNNWNDWML